jgi:hypothetical protein
MVYTGIGFVVDIEAFLACKIGQRIGCGSGSGSGPATQNDPLLDAKSEEGSRFFFWTKNYRSFDSG